MPSFIRKSILVLLVLSNFMLGCASPMSSGKAEFYSKSEKVTGTRTLKLTESLRVLEVKRGEDPSCPDCGELLCTKDALIKIRRRGSARAALIALFVFIVIFLVIVDIFLLPAYHRRRDCFPCTRRTYVVFVD